MQIQFVSKTTFTDKELRFIQVCKMAGLRTKPVTLLGRQYSVTSCGYDCDGGMVDHDKGFMQYQAKTHTYTITLEPI